MKYFIVFLAFVISFYVREYIDVYHSPVQYTLEDPKDTEFLHWCIPYAKSKGLSPTQSWSLCLFGRLKGV